MLSLLLRCRLLVDISASERFREMNETYLGTTSSASAIFGCVILNFVIETINKLNKQLIIDFNLLVQLYATVLQGCLLVSLVNIAAIHRLGLP